MWNAKLEPSVLIAQLEDMHAHGLRNVCVHPFPKAFRPGQFTTEMEPDYLTPGFLDVIRCRAPDTICARAESISRDSEAG